jgi:F-type H+-transporting ATPase subunit b
MLRAAEAEMEQQMNQAREQLRADVVKLALQGAQQVLGRDVDEKAHTEQLNRLAEQL